jgi:pyrroline-5-carboxylate reductase
LKNTGVCGILASVQHKEMTMANQKRLGVIGAGKMGAALIKGLIGAKVMSPDEILSADVDREALDRLRKETAVTTTTDNRELARFSQTVLLAIKPDQVKPVLEGIKEMITPSHLIVSIAAGVPIRTIESALSSGCRVVRVMPNTPALVGAGASAFSPGTSATRQDAEQVRVLLTAVGIAVELPEKHLDAVTGLSGSGPAYVFMVIEALADGGVKMGLPRTVALQLAAQTVMGSARLLLETGRHPGELKDQVASPGGTTIAGLAALERNGLRAALIEAVESATRRSMELGKTG